MQKIRESLRLIRLRNQNRKQYMNLVLGEPYNNPIPGKHYTSLVLGNELLNTPGVSGNDNVTMKEVLEYPDFPWDWDSLFANDNITPLDVVRNPHLPWTRNKKLPNYHTIAEVAEYLEVEHNLEAIISDPRDIAMVLVSRSEITIKDVLRFPNKDWYMCMLSSNPNITMKDILSTNLDWKWNCVSSNPNLTLQNVLDHSELPWELYSLSSKVTLQEVLDNPHLPWIWYEVSKNPNITLQMILDHPELPWVWGYVSCNPSVTLNDVLNHPELDWDWRMISTNRGLRIQDVLDHPDLNWNYEIITHNSFDYIFTDR